MLVLPGSPQLLTEALQARKSDATGRIRVVPSASVAEVYWALAMDLPDSPDPEERIAAMQEALEGTEALRVVTSGGSSVAFRKGTPAAEAATPLEAVLAGLRSIPDISRRCWRPWARPGPCWSAPSWTAGTSPPTGPWR